jgi:hypothetical protein
VDLNDRASSLWQSDKLCSAININLGTWVYAEQNKLTITVSDF